MVPWSPGVLGLLMFILCNAFAANVDPCQRQPFKASCPPTPDGKEVRSQFVLRYYKRQNECVSYPYGHCRKNPDEPELYKYKDECEQNCIGGGGGASAKEVVAGPFVNGTSTTKLLATYANYSATKLYTNKVDTSGSTQTVGLTTGTTKVVPTSAEAKKAKTKCEQQKDAANRGTSGNSVSIVGGFVPRCDSEGQFEQVQCDDTAKVCWCTDEDGLEFPGTRTQTASPSWNSPNCSNALYGYRLPDNVATDPNGKSGTCPQPGLGEFGVCIRECRKDADCPGPAKCCYNGCGRLCFKPGDERTTASPAPTLNQAFLVQCDVSPDVGPCKQSYTKWFYDKADKTCKTFSYGGCAGNGNNFESQRECEIQCAAPTGSLCGHDAKPLLDESGVQFDCLNKTCPSGHLCTFSGRMAVCCPTNEQSISNSNSLVNAEEPSTICKLPKDRGSCEKFELRFYFNEDIGECKYFFFSGCGGNKNNFKELSTCQTFCGVQSGSQQVTAANEAAVPASSSVTSTSSSSTSTSSSPTSTSTSPTLPTTSTTTTTIAQTTPTTTPSTTTTTTQSTTTTTATSTTSSTTTSASTTKASSTSAFAGNAPSPSPPGFAPPGHVPSLPAAPVHVHTEEVLSGGLSSSGPPSSPPTLLLNFPKINPTTPKGFQGFSPAFLAPEPASFETNGPASAFTFPSQLVANSTVIQKSFQDGRCQKPKDSGPCSGKFVKWFFDPVHLECETFNFGGCQGNSNNFDSREACLAACRELPQNVCMHPLDRGNCNNFFTRWWFDPIDHFCKQFAYSGCGGNGNNFATQQDCSSKCKVACPRVTCQPGCIVITKLHGCQECACLNHTNVTSFNRLDPFSAPNGADSFDCPDVQCPFGCVQVRQRGACAECNCTSTVSARGTTPSIKFSATKSAVLRATSNIANIPNRCPDIKKCPRDCIRLGFDDCPYCGCHTNGTIIEDHGSTSQQPQLTGDQLPPSASGPDNFAIPRPTAGVVNRVTDNSLNEFFPAANNSSLPAAPFSKTSSSCPAVPAVCGPGCAKSFDASGCPTCRCVEITNLPAPAATSSSVLPSSVETKKPIQCPQVFCGRECVQVTNVFGCQECACTFPQSSSHVAIPVAGEKSSSTSAPGNIDENTGITMTLHELVAQPAKCEEVHCDGQCVKVTNELGCPECSCTFDRSNDTTSSITTNVQLITVDENVETLAPVVFTKAPNVELSTLVTAAVNPTIPTVAFTAPLQETVQLVKNLANGTNCPPVSCGQDCVQVTNPLGCQECACTFAQNASNVALPVTVSTSTPSTTTPLSTTTLPPTTALPEVVTTPRVKVKVVNQKTKLPVVSEVEEVDSASVEAVRPFTIKPLVVPANYSVMPAHFVNPATIVPAAVPVVTALPEQVRATEPAPAQPTESAHIDFDTEDGGEHSTIAASNGNRQPVLKEIETEPAALPSQRPNNASDLLGNGFSGMECQNVVCNFQCFPITNQRGCPECLCPVGVLPIRKIVTTTESPDAEEDLADEETAEEPSMANFPVPKAFDRNVPSVAKNTEKPQAETKAISRPAIDGQISPVDQTTLEKCSQPKDPGECKGPNQRRWWYNLAERRCETFDYTGCAGNKNHFYSLRECEIHCQNFFGNLTTNKQATSAVQKSIASAPSSATHRKISNIPLSALQSGPGFAPSLGAQIPQASFIPEHEIDISNPPRAPAAPAPTRNEQAVTQKTASSPPSNFVPVNTIATAVPVAPEEQTPNPVPAGLDPACALIRDPGPCANFVPRWFFNLQTNRCEQFQFGSCAGNNNNFESEDICKARCLSGAAAMNVAVPPVCAPEKDRGTCNQYKPRYYFNSRNLRCELFVWSGCGGNSNNFEDKETCDITCPVFDRINNNRNQIGTNNAPVLSQPQTELQPLNIPIQNRPPLATNIGAYPNPNLGTNQYPNNGVPFLPINMPLPSCCPQIIQPPIIQQQYQAAGPCSLRQDPGPCYGYIPRWYFEISLGQCLPFFYGGCQGNPNNFVTKEECESACRQPQLLPPQNFETQINQVQPQGQSYGGQQPIPQQPKGYGQPSQPASGGYQNNQAAPVPASNYASPQTPQPQPSYNPAPATQSPQNNYQPSTPSPSYSIPQPQPKPSQTYPSTQPQPPSGGYGPPATGYQAPGQGPSNDGIARCPNGQPAVQYPDGRPVLCLPGRDQCPPSSSCYFNGMDFSCCPSSEDPYDKSQGLGNDVGTGYGQAPAPATGGYKQQQPAPPPKQGSYGPVKFQNLELMPPSSFPPGVNPPSGGSGGGSGGYGGGQQPSSGGYGGAQQPTGYGGGSPSSGSGSGGKVFGPPTLGLQAPSSSPQGGSGCGQGGCGGGLNPPSSFPPGVQAPGGSGGGYGGQSQPSSGGYGGGQPSKPSGGYGGSAPAGCGSPSPPAGCPNANGGPSQGIFPTSNTGGGGLPSVFGPPTIPGGPANKQQKQHCNQPRDPGPCKGTHLRYFYDPSSDTCKLFYYGGCQGNKNNFGTMTLCETDCVTINPVGPCPGGALPLGGRSPMICGLQQGAIECPVGYGCVESVCCLIAPPSTAPVPPGAPGILPRPPGIVPNAPSTNPQAQAQGQGNAGASGAPGVFGPPTLGSGSAGNCGGSGSGNSQCGNQQPAGGYGGGQPASGGYGNSQPSSGGYGAGQPSGGYGGGGQKGQGSSGSGGIFGPPTLGLNPPSSFPPGVNQPGGGSGCGQGGCGGGSGGLQPPSSFPPGVQAPGGGAGGYGNSQPTSGGYGNSQPQPAAGGYGGGQTSGGYGGNGGQKPQTQPGGGVFGPPTLNGLNPPSSFPPGVSQPGGSSALQPPSSFPPGVQAPSGSGIASAALQPPSSFPPGVQAPGGGSGQAVGGYGNAAPAQPPSSGYGNQAPATPPPSGYNNQAPATPPPAYPNPTPAPAYPTPAPPAAYPTPAPAAYPAQLPATPAPAAYPTPAPPAYPAQLPATPAPAAYPTPAPPAYPAQLPATPAPAAYPTPAPPAYPAQLPATPAPAAYPTPAQPAYPAQLPATPAPAAYPTPAPPASSYGGAGSGPGAAQALQPPSSLPPSVAAPSAAGGSPPSSVPQAPSSVPPGSSPAALQPPSSVPPGVASPSSSGQASALQPPSSVPPGVAAPSSSGQGSALQPPSSFPPGVQAPSSAGGAGGYGSPPPPPPSSGYGSQQPAQQPSSYGSPPPPPPSSGYGSQQQQPAQQQSGYGGSVPQPPAFPSGGYGGGGYGGGSSSSGGASGGRVFGAPTIGGLQPPGSLPPGVQGPGGNCGQGKQCGGRSKSGSGGARIFGPPTLPGSEPGEMVPPGCPDGGPALKDSSGRMRTCGAGFDGSPLCPKGFYCHIDLEAGLRVCCDLGQKEALQPPGILPPGVAQPGCGSSSSGQPNTNCANGSGNRNQGSGSSAGVFGPPTLPGLGGTGSGCGGQNQQGCGSQSQSSGGYGGAQPSSGGYGGGGSGSGGSGKVFGAPTLPNGLQAPSSSPLGGGSGSGCGQSGCGGGLNPPSSFPPGVNPPSSSGAGGGYGTPAPSPSQGGYGGSQQPAAGYGGGSSNTGGSGKVFGAPTLPNGLQPPSSSPQGSGSGSGCGQSGCGGGLNPPSSFPPGVNPPSSSGAGGGYGAPAPSPSQGGYGGNQQPSSGYGGGSSNTGGSGKVFGAPTLPNGLQPPSSSPQGSGSGCGQGGCGGSGGLSPPSSFPPGVNPPSSSGGSGGYGAPAPSQGGYGGSQQQPAAGGYGGSQQQPASGYGGGSSSSSSGGSGKVFGAPTLPNGLQAPSSSPQSGGSVSGCGQGGCGGSGGLSPPSSFPPGVNPPSSGSSGGYGAPAPSQGGYGGSQQQPAAGGYGGGNSNAGGSGKVFGAPTLPNGLQAPSSSPQQGSSGCGQGGCGGNGGLSPPSSFPPGVNPPSSSGGSGGYGAPAPSQGGYGGSQQQPAAGGYGGGSSSTGGSGKVFGAPTLPNGLQAPSSSPQQGNSGCGQGGCGGGGGLNPPSSFPPGVNPPGGSGGGYGKPASGGYGAAAPSSGGYGAPAPSSGGYGAQGPSGSGGARIFGQPTLPNGLQAPSSSPQGGQGGQGGYGGSQQSGGCGQGGCSLTPPSPQGQGGQGCGQGGCSGGGSTGSGGSGPIKPPGSFPPGESPPTGAAFEKSSIEEISLKSAKNTTSLKNDKGKMSNDAIRICLQPADSGRRCKDDESEPKTNLMYYYSDEDNRCKLFFYKGCEGNDNRFSSRRDCAKLCQSQGDS